MPSMNFDSTFKQGSLLFYIYYSISTALLLQNCQAVSQSEKKNRDVISVIHLVQAVI